MPSNIEAVRYFVHAVDGNVYGPGEINEINQWIAEGRVVPTTLLQPENSQMRVAASTIPGLTWAPGQTFDAYSPQVLSTAKYELAGSWACLVASLILCCLPFGVHVSLGIGGMILSAMAYRKGRPIALLPLVLNLALVGLHIIMRRTTGATSLDPQQLQELMKNLPNR